MAVKKLIARDVANFSCLISSSHMNRMCTRFNSDVSQSVLPLGMRSAERLVRKRKQLLDKKKKKKKRGEKAVGNKADWKTNRVNVKYWTEMESFIFHKMKNTQHICKVWTIYLQKFMDIQHTNISKRFLLVVHGDKWATKWANGHLFFHKWEIIYMRQGVYLRTI